MTVCMDVSATWWLPAAAGHAAGQSPRMSESGSMVRLHGNARAPMPEETSSFRQYCRGSWQVSADKMVTVVAILC